MSEPFLAEVRMFGFNFPPRGWAQCDGQLLPINQNQSLFSLLGTIYGGDGRTTFALPELRGRSPTHVGDGFTQGQKGGEERHALSINEMPSHDHTLNASSGGGSAGNTASGNVPTRGTAPLYSQANQLTTMSPSAVANTGGSQSHQNMQPYLTINFVIALQGLFPSRN